MNEHILIPFGLHIKQLRLKKNISQEELAALCSLDRTYISGIERGIRNVSLVNIIKLANGLQVEAQTLLQFTVGEFNE
ncbi:helix-turn-helix domain-containing protein [Vibrio tapetis]|uniref:Transcriptional regulator, XRE family n=1 Tax=Vibrio tapetis subsp. tapetis TaxID=1671868 RepID=A0A2N8ZKB6_9VIBR|nr:helix-turn-helix transcriptional regulator [Vibrio tapetis]SON52343.1 Transcriptional regulator, XRE family [Vibrio tapetis subsp. tapetis]